MEQFKRTQVIMLPTENTSDIFLAKKGLSKPKLLYHPTAAYKYYEKDRDCNQHLYIISDDKIKEGDWKYNSKMNCIVQHNRKDKELPNELKIASRWCKKIIATTDTSLTIKHKESPYLRDWDLPQPSQQFIEKYIESYNKGIILSDVLVEYEEYCEKLICNNKDCNNSCINIQNRPKVNPKDNTITIKKLKDSWNLEEMCSNMQYYMEHCKKVGYITPHQWLKENL